MKVLEQEKHNIKGTWKILNSIIRKGQKFTSFPDSFENNGATLKNKTDIANGFNDFFVKVGPNLAEKIEKPNGNTNVETYLGRSNGNSMLLNPIEESEIIDIVRNCKHKKSTDYDNIDMSVIKHVIYYIVKPFTHVCHS